MYYFDGLLNNRCSDSLYQLTVQITCSVSHLGILVSRNKDVIYIINSPAVIHKRFDLNLHTYLGSTDTEYLAVDFCANCTNTSSKNEYFLSRRNRSMRTSI